MTRGMVTVEDGCGGEQSYTVGQAFEEGGRVQRPTNLFEESTFAYKTFIIPLGQPTTVNVPATSAGVVPRGVSRSARMAVG